MKRSRKNVKPSYAEAYFMKCIERDFRDKHYRREHPIGYYFADFAWPHKKRIIEIDSKAHLQKTYAERDKLKDICMKEKGWKILRIKWVNILKHPQYYLKKAEMFIGPMT